MNKTLCRANSMFESPVKKRLRRRRIIRVEVEDSEEESDELCDSGEVNTRCIKSNPETLRKAIEYGTSLYEENKQQKEEIMNLKKKQVSMSSEINIIKIEKDSIEIAMHEKEVENRNLKVDLIEITNKKEKLSRNHRLLQSNFNRVLENNKELRKNQRFSKMQEKILERKLSIHLENCFCHNQYHLHQEHNNNNQEEHRIYGLERNNDDVGLNNPYEMNVGSSFDPLRSCSMGIIFKRKRRNISLLNKCLRKNKSKEEEDKNTETVKINQLKIKSLQRKIDHITSDVKEIMKDTKESIVMSTKAFSSLMKETKDAIDGIGALVDLISSEDESFMKKVTLQTQIDEIKERMEEKYNEQIQNFIKFFGINDIYGGTKTE